MPPIKTIRLLWTFYRNFILASGIITIYSLVLFVENGIRIFVGLFWLKIITLGLTFLYINQYKKRQYYYYYNSGISKLFLWVTTLSFDFTLFIILIILTYKLQ
jgi:hypothetical protein